MLKRSRSSTVFVASLCVYSITIAVASVPNTLSYSITEEREAGVVIGNVARDLELESTFGSDAILDMRFSFLARPPTSRSEENVFAIDEYTSDLTTVKSIDRDVLCPGLPDCIVELTIQIKPASYFSIVKIKIRIDDVNDHVPSFATNIATFTISEASPVGVKIVLPTATDDDSPRYAIQRYTLVPPSDTFSLVTVGEEGELHMVLQRSLDREHIESYTFSVMACDGGNQSGVVQIRINVLDVNDNNPQFVNSTYRVSMYENTRPGTTIVKVEANDPDHGQGGQIEYAFDENTNANYERLFSINRFGDVTLLANVDREKMSLYVLTVTARNPVEGALPVKVKVFINVTDVNDNAPIIGVNTLTTTGTAEILENVPQGSFVAHITVTDADSGVNSQCACFVDSSHFIIHNLFDTEFKIITAMPLDRETQDTYIISIRCDDFGFPSLSSTHNITVHIGDDNDNAPVFEKTQYNVKMTENNDVDDFLVRTIATDLDDGLNGKVAFSLGEGTSGHFSIDANGDISVRASVDRESQSQYDFLVFAVDSGNPPRTASVNVHVEVGDVDDEMPTFLKRLYNFTLSENTPVNTSVGRVEAVDADTTAHALFNYVLDYDGTCSAFFIDAISGVIYTNAVIDRELLSVCNLEIMAVPTIKSTALSNIDRTTVRIDILDVNDNTPVLEFTNGTTQHVHSATPIGHEVYQLHAQDSDVGINAELSFSLTAGNEADLFSIDKQTGAVTLVKDLTKVDHVQFNLTVRVSDNGVPALFAESPLTIIVNNTIPFTSAQTSDDNPIASGSMIFAVIAGVILVVLFVVAAVCFQRRRAIQQEKLQSQFRQRVTKQLEHVEDVESAECGHRPVYVGDALPPQRICDAGLQEISCYDEKDNYRTEILLNSLPDCSYQLQRSSGVGEPSRDAESASSETNTTDSGRGSSEEVNSPSPNVRQLPRNGSKAEIASIHRALFLWSRGKSTEPANSRDRPYDVTEQFTIDNESHVSHTRQKRVRLASQV